MNQKNIFYVLSLLAVFFIGHYYSQFNVKPQTPKIFATDNFESLIKSEGYVNGFVVEQYKADILKLQLQLEELDNQLIFSLDELRTISQKLNLASGKIRVLEEELSSTQDAFKLNNISLKESNNKLFENEKTLKELKDLLSSEELDNELTKFELELAEELLEYK